MAYETIRFQKKWKLHYWQDEYDNIKIKPDSEVNGDCFDDDDEDTEANMKIAI